MATPPEKPQQHSPLHNFTLPELKWSKNHSNNLHRGRRLERSQLKSRFRLKKKAGEIVVQEEDKPKVDEDEEEGQKTWNLRPSNVDGASTLQDDKAALPPIAKSSDGVKTTPKRPKKPMFSLTLTPEEIEEDIFAMTGLKPSRKPKRRPKAVQKQLDVRRFAI
ncbi:hypothetical protein LguiB_011038 [Lonicera macranthoides]